MSGLGFWRLAEADPAARAVVGPDGSVLTRGELAALSNRVARLLRAGGLARGDRVVAVPSNEPAVLALVLACQQAGAYFVPVNTALTTPEIAHILRDAGPAAVFASAEYTGRVREAVSESGTACPHLFASGPADGFQDLAEAAAPFGPSPLEDRAAGSFMGYTSGTTGRPKGVMRGLPEGDPDDVFGRGAEWQLGMFGIEPLKDGVHLVTSPLSHTAVSGLALASLHFGHTVVLTSRFDAEETLRIVQRERVTTTHMVPTQLHRLLRLPEEVRGACDVSSMRTLIHGAGPCPPEVKRQIIDWFGPVVVEYYGATEAAGTVATSREWLDRPGTVGRPQPGAEVRILDDEGRLLPAGEPGRVFLGMGAHAFEYRNDPDKTRSGRSGDFVTVGDLGYLDEDGYLFLLGRTSEVVVSGGVNVYPAEVEAAILEHPDVVDVGVIGLPDPEWGHTVCAVVQAVPGSVLAGGARAGEILPDFLASRLARFKTPRRYLVVDALPRGANGKLRKHLLTEMAGARTDEGGRP
ncbi:AMP-binding protein [Actinomadura rugatobispora]|uniref:AMP-binding protein n=1 Tax=Actinomadura rugatobispora TaxID=1994 RepID=A0ABW1AC48_9ACTN|nr:fatty-acid--CoA ligase FadD4 [Actinomadura rugatobispora]